MKTRTHCQRNNSKQLFIYHKLKSGRWAMLILFSTRLGANFCLQKRSSTKTLSQVLSCFFGTLNLIAKALCTLHLYSSLLIEKGSFFVIQWLKLHKICDKSLKTVYGSSLAYLIFSQRN